MPTLNQFLKEDMYDQLVLLRSEMKLLNNDIDKTRARNGIYKNQMKQKDKFIDELLKSTYQVDQSIAEMNVQDEGSSLNEMSTSKENL